MIRKVCKKEAKKCPRLTGFSGGSAENIE